MASSAVIPGEHDLLCERCGYTLSNLPVEGNCPECGEPIAKSVGEHRHPPVWELNPNFRSWISTSWMILLHPTRFFTTFTARGPMQPAREFSRWHWALSGGLLGGALFLHAQWYFALIGKPSSLHWTVIGASFFTMIVLASIVNRLAGGLTAWEARMRGLRMPIAVVSRALHYHAPHYLPVAVIALGTVAGYRLLLMQGIVGVEAATIYLYVLCAEVIIGAAYLFQTYWIAMRSIRYANR